MSNAKRISNKRKSIEKKWNYKKMTVFQFLFRIFSKMILQQKLMKANQPRKPYPEGSWKLPLNKNSILVGEKGEEMIFNHDGSEKDFSVNHAKTKPIILQDERILQMLSFLEIPLKD